MTGHNHLTRDIRPLGACPKCDEYHARRAAEAAPVVVVSGYGPEVRFRAAMREGDTVWSLECSHLHRTPEAALRCFPKVRKLWSEWGHLPRVPVPHNPNHVVEMERPLGPTTKAWMRMSPLEPPYYQVLQSLQLGKP